MREWLESEKEALRRGTWVSTDAILYGDFLDRYLKEVAAHTIGPKTLESYTHTTNKHIRPVCPPHNTKNARNCLEVGARCKECGFVGKLS